MENHIFKFVFQQDFADKYIQLKYAWNEVESTNSQS